MSILRTLFFLVVGAASGCTSTGHEPLPAQVAVAAPPAPVPSPGAGALPFSFSYPQNISDFNTLDDFLRAAGAAPSPSPLDKYFSVGTLLTYRPEQYGHPYRGTARLFKQLPDIADHKALLFAYWDKETDYKLPTLELQIFDAGYRLTDKLIVVDGTSYECSWTRSVHISPAYEVRITDRDVCYDVEADAKISDTAYTTTFRLSQNGTFAPQHQPPPTIETTQSGWDGHYSLVFPTGEEVTGLSGEPVQFTIEIAVDISGAAARYKETHTRNVATEFTCRTKRDANSITLYAAQSVISGTSLPKKSLCTITKRGTQFYLTPGNGSNFSSIEPISPAGLLLMRKQN